MIRAEKFNVIIFFMGIIFLFSAVLLFPRHIIEFREYFYSGKINFSDIFESPERVVFVNLISIIGNLILLLVSLAILFRETVNLIFYRKLMQKNIYITFDKWETVFALSLVKNLNKSRIKCTYETKDKTYVFYSKPILTEKIKNQKINVYVNSIENPIVYHVKD